MFREVSVSWFEKYKRSLKVDGLSHTYEDLVHRNDTKRAEKKAKSSRGALN